jgi:uncharacterized protein (TIGR04255 family)
MFGTPFQLNLNETFPRLARPPIVEAVIHWQARAQNPIEPETLGTKLNEQFPDYSTRKPLHQVELITLVSDKSDESFVQHKKGWEGIRLESDDKKYIVQFKRDGLVFSRINGYEHWQPFSAAAKKAWHAYLKVAAPLEIQRLGVRFINQIAGATLENLTDFLREPPTCPSNFQLKEFVYQSTFAVPGVTFGVRVIKVMQPSMPELQKSSGLFLDIDVFTNNAISTDEAELEKTLEQMRWLKNKVFFTLLTDHAVKVFGADQ